VDILSRAVTADEAVTIVGSGMQVFVHGAAATPTPLLDAKFVADMMDLDEVSVNDYGDMAVAFTSQQERSRYDGSDTSGHYHYTNVWQKRDGRWQVVASHGTRYDTGDFHEAE